jgi:hypothetical protein
MKIWGTQNSNAKSQAKKHFNLTDITLDPAGARDIGFILCGISARVEHILWHPECTLI